MDNFDEKLKKALKQDIELSSKYENAVKNAVEKSFKKYKNTNFVNYKKHRFISHLSKIAGVFLIGILSVTAYAEISSNINFKEMGFLKLSNNYEQKKIEINQSVENDYVKIDVENVARDSAYMVIEYDITLKDKALTEMDEVEYDIDYGYMLGIVNKIWIDEESASFVRSNTEKISDTEYKYSQIINLMNFNKDKIHLKVWIDNFYIAPYGENTGVKINKMIQMDVTLNSDNNKIASQEQKIDDNTTIILEDVENSSFETYIKLKRITKDITWKEYSNNIEYYKFVVSSENNDTISSYCYSGDILGHKVYIKNPNGYELVEPNTVKDNDIVKVEDTYAVILEDVTNIGKLKVMQTKSTFFSDRTDEEKTAYNKAKWYNVEAGEKTYIEENNKGGTFEVNKIVVDEDNIIFYYNKKGLFGNTSYIDIRYNNGTMNYICPSKIEIKGLTSDENKIIFSRKSFRHAGLNIRDGMLNDISKLQFTMLYGDVDEVIGEPFIIEVPEQKDEKTKIDNFSISDTICEIYKYKEYSSNYYYKLTYGLEELEDNKVEEREMFFKIDYYNDQLLNYTKYTRIGGNEYYFEDKNDIKELVKEIENIFNENKIEYKKEEFENGKLYESDF